MLRVQLTPDTTPWHYVAFLAAAFILISQFIFANSTQPFLLVEFYRIPADSVGRANAWPLLADQLVSMAMLGVWGILSDRWLGRRWIFVAGFVLMGTAMWLIAWLVIYEIYGLIILCRLWFAVGAAAASSMIASTMADYVHEQDKAKVSGTLGLVTGLGAMLGALGFTALPAHLATWFDLKLALALQYSYIVCGFVCVLTAVLLTFGLKPDHPKFLRRRYQLLEDDSDAEDEINDEIQQHTRDNNILPTNSEGDNGNIVPKSTSKSAAASPVRIKPQHLQLAPAEVCPFVNIEAISARPIQKRKSFWQLAYEGLMLAKNPVILLAYLSGFIARGDSTVITLFVALWVDTYFVEHGLCPSDESNGPGFLEESPIKRGSCAAAIRRAYMLSGIAQSAALAGAPLFAFISHKLSHTPSLMIAALTSMVGYLAFAILPSPMHPTAFFAAIMAGLGEIGVIITSLRTCASNDLVPRVLRGSVGGCYSVFGALGLLVSTQLGGLLFDRWWHGSPFFIMGGLSALVAIGCFIAMIMLKRGLGQVQLSSSDDSTAPTESAADPQ